MKQINLTQGKVALVDDCDYEFLNQYKWFAVKSNNTFYAQRAIPANNKRKQILIWMHRVILNVPNGMITDHINMDGLDNRRHNLRICTHSQNSRNTKPMPNSTSIYKGVYKYKKKWVASIKKDSKNIYIGCFDNEIEAAKAYDRKAKEFSKDFAYLNFKEEM